MTELEQVKAERDAMMVECLNMREALKNVRDTSSSTRLVKLAHSALTNPSAKILARHDAAIWREAIILADAVRLRLVETYGKNVQENCADMVGNKGWERLEGAVKVVQALRAKADELEKAQ